MDPGTRGPRVDAALRTSRAGRVRRGQPAARRRDGRRGRAERAPRGGRGGGVRQGQRAGRRRASPIECEPPLGWIAPNAIAPRGAARPPRGRFALRSLEFARRPRVEVVQDGPAALEPAASRRLVPGRSARLPHALDGGRGSGRRARCACGWPRAGKGRQWSTRSRPSAWRRTPSGWRSTPSSSASGSRTSQSDWERKEQDASVPGAQPDPDEEDESWRRPTSRTSCPRRGRPRPRRTTTGEERRHGQPGRARRGGDEHRQPGRGGRRLLAAERTPYPRSVWTRSEGRSRRGLRRCSPSGSCCCSSTRPR